MALVFNPIGFGGRMEPEDAARFQAEAIADATLVEAVPTEITENFERARKLHLYGVLEYEFFTVASDQALLVLESALRVRFLSYYAGGIPVTRDGVEETLYAKSFEDVRRARGTLKLRGREVASRLAVGARALLGWARGERLLPGSSTQRVDHALGALRNYAAHQEGRAVLGPPDSARPCVTSPKSSTPSGAIACPAGASSPLRSRGCAGRIDCPRREGGPEWGSITSMTSTPANRTRISVSSGWGCDEKLTSVGGTTGRSPSSGCVDDYTLCPDLGRRYAGLVERSSPAPFTDLGDRVEHLDRLFFVRRRDGQTDEPRSAADLLALDRPPAGRWHAGPADDPRRASVRVQDTGKGLVEGRGGAPLALLVPAASSATSVRALALARDELVEARPRS